MRIVREEEFILQAEPTLKKVFVENEDTEPFLPHIKERLLLYFPLGGDQQKNNHTENRLFEAIAAAANSIGNTGCYFVVGWGWLKNKAEENRYASIPISELKEAFVPLSTGRDKIIWNQLELEEIFPDFCLCSVEGDWGLLKTVDEYAFLGGSSEFMQAVKRYFPDVEKEVFEFLHDFKLAQNSGEKIDVDWLRELLSNVYDSVVANQMLVDSKLIKL